MSMRSKKPPVAKRRTMTRADLELAIAEAIRTGRPECSALIAVIVEGIVPTTPNGTNWAVKAIKFGKADRDQCRAVLSKLLEDGQFEVQISD